MAVQTGTGVNPLDAVTVSKFKNGRPSVPGGNTTFAVVFGSPFADANYSVKLGCSDNYVSWITARLNTGFTINVSAAPGAPLPVDFIAIHD
jgi:hypothetical protein